MPQGGSSLDIFWLCDKRLTDLDSLDAPDVLAQDIVDNLATGSERLCAIAAFLSQEMQTAFDQMTPLKPLGKWKSQTVAWCR